MIIYIWIDKYYCSIDLFIHLYKKGIRATGTNLNLKLHETILYKYEDIIHLIF